MKVEILSVGTELLMGQIANTNAQYISKKLPEAGLGVFYHSVVGDNPERLKECLNLALSRADVIIMTGGLGPTQDDLTKETVAVTLGLNMIMNEGCARNIKEYFKQQGREMVESNYRQAYFPENAIILDNVMGTAPGCIIETNTGKIIVLLPGPPKELIPMFDSSVMPYFMKKADHKLYSKFVKVVGQGESLVEAKLMELVDMQTNPTIATYAKDGIVTVRVTAMAETEEKARGMVLNMVDRIIEILGQAVYSIEGEEIETTVFNKLLRLNLHVAFAESCTGGMLAEHLTSLPGSSQVFEYGVVTYANAAKHKLLGVSDETLYKYGAVSRETAMEMASGICKVSGADIGVSITGIAGPDGGTEKKPIGLVYIGIKKGSFIEAKEFNFSGNRDRIRNLSVINAFDMIRSLIDNEISG